MFTGLVQGIGRVRAARGFGGDVSLTISPGFGMPDLKVGDSISVDGVCLTVTRLLEGAFVADVSGETLSRSTLKLIKPGNEVNLEQALRLSDRLGGHLVTGHVDGVGKIAAKDHQQRSWLVQIRIPETLSRYTIEKGSVAVDGISLTINRCGSRYFEVNIIPQTGRETTLLKKSPGDLVNIETDLIGKYVERFLSRDKREETGRALSRGIDREMLLRQGFGE